MLSVKKAIKLNSVCNFDSTQLYDFYTLAWCTASQSLKQNYFLLPSFLVVERTFNYFYLLREPKPVCNNQMGNNTRARALSRLSFPFHIHPSREMNLWEVCTNYIFLHIYVWCLICAAGIENVHTCRRTMRQSEKVSKYVRPFIKIYPHTPIIFIAGACMQKHCVTNDPQASFRLSTWSYDHSLMRFTLTLMWVGKKAFLSFQHTKAARRQAKLSMHSALGLWFASLLPINHNCRY